MLDSELKVNQFLMHYCRRLVADVADERMAEQPLLGVNHPASILGHLAFSADRATRNTHFANRMFCHFPAS
jgi:hypothetical protein